MKGKGLGTALLIAGVAAIVTGIIFKRVLGLREFLMLFHIAGGILLVSGISVFILGRNKAK